MTDTPPQVYGGRYQLAHRIARGGMADVYLAHDNFLDRPVALKVLFPEFATDQSFVERFRREAQAAANLNHPNIVSVYDWGEEGGTYFIVMEYVDGRSLAQIVREEGPLQPDRAAEVCADIAIALEFAHRNGVIHRDVKPGNVLMSPLGQVKVTDFGIARAVSASENLTQTGTVMGTATYFSPEQARGEPVDPRSDVYSLGVVLYELLVGAPPFTGDSPVSVAYKHVSESAELPRTREPRVPIALEAVTMRALAKNPANRYASAEDMAADLTRFAHGQPVLAESVLAPEQLTQALSATARADATRAVPRTDATRTMTAVDDGGPGDRRSPAFWAVLAVLALLVIGGLAALAVNLSKSSGGAATVDVPSVTGKTQDEAKTILEDAGLQPEFTPQASDTVAEGVVISQQPPGGTKADEGSTVTALVSSGKTPVEVPDVIGRTQEDATRALREAGLSWTIRPETDADHEAGTVIDQSPDAGSQLQPGKAVTLTVSQGPEAVGIPDVTGMSTTEAANALGRAGFVADNNATEEPSDTVEAGKVTRTDPAAGTPAQPGTTVHMYTSSGPAPNVPDVIGENQLQAVAELRQAGYVVSRELRTTSDPAEDGIVLDQSPPGGAQAAEGSTVTIVVGRFFGTSSSTSSTTTSTSTP